MVNPDAASWSKTQNLFHNQYRQYRIPIKIKEEARGPQGSRFHFTDVKLKPGCFYVLRLIGTAYEVEDGQQVWPTFVAKNKKGEMADYRIRWLQNKFFFFNTRGEEQIDEEPLGGLQQYVALAYPAAPDSKLFNNAEDKDEAYMHDIARPTIALNTDLEGKAYTKGKLTWQLRSRKVGNENWAKTEVQPNRFVRDGSSFVNMQPQYAFSPYKAKSADKNSDYEYNLQVLYTKQVAGAGVDCMAKLTAEENFSMLTDFMREHGMYDGYAAVAGGTPEETAAAMGTQLAIVLLGLYGADQYDGDADAFQNALNTYYDQKGLACQKDTVIVLADMTFRGSDRPYEPAPSDQQVEDTLTSMCRFVLSWEDKVHSSFEIERRERGSGEWERLNKRPYVSMVEQTDYEGLVVFSDSVPYVGAWEYRVMAHDAFGELTPPSPVHIAYARDIQPPLAPQLKYIVLERPDDSDPMSRILAHVVWENPNAEKQDGDVQGYVIQYYNEDITGRQWQPITQLLADKTTPATTLISPTDTTAVVDVTGLRTGMMAISAYDNSGNENMGLAQMVRITDFKAPAPPDSLTATVLPSGNVLLRWQCHPADNDIAYFDLAFANDSTHEFLLRNQGGIQQEGFIDTLAMNVNQKYIYYKVRAKDWSNNIGLWSKAVQVKRPHNTPPSAPHLDESWHNDQKGMHMRWVVGTDADMDYHLLLRRLGGEGEKGKKITIGPFIIGKPIEFPWFPAINDKSLRVNRIWNNEKKEMTFVGKYSLKELGTMHRLFNRNYIPALCLKKGKNIVDYIYPEEGNYSATLKTGMAYHFYLPTMDDDEKFSPCYFKNVSDKGPVAIDKALSYNATSPHVILMSVTPTQLTRYRNPFAADEYKYLFTYSFSTLVNVAGMDNITQWGITEEFYHYDRVYNKKQDKKQSDGIYKINWSLQEPSDDPAHGVLFSLLPFFYVEADKTLGNSITLAFRGDGYWEVEDGEGAESGQLEVTVTTKRSPSYKNQGNRGHLFIESIEDKDGNIVWQI